MGNEDYEFMKGVVWSAARVVELHDQPVIANDIIKEANIPRYLLMSCDEYDLEYLRREDKSIPKGDWPDSLTVIYMINPEWVYESKYISLFRTDDSIVTYSQWDVDHGYAPIEIYTKDQFLEFKKEAEK